MLIWLAACDPAVNPAADDSSAPPATTPVAECSPVVQINGAFGAIDTTRVADPHQNVFGASPEPYHVRYAWPGSDPSQSASFLWRTDAETFATAVELSVDGGFDIQVEGSSYLFGGPPGTPGPYRIHEVKICSGLLPGTTYTYHVGGDGHWSQNFSFTTPGEPGSFDSFRVGIAGDSRGTYETWGLVLSAIDSFDPDFLMFSGDMIDFGTNQAEWDGWFEASGDILARKALVAAHGNHEFLAPQYFAQFSLPNNEQWYHVRYGDLEIVVLNDTVFGATDIVDQATYIDQVFAASDAPWKTALHHQSAYAACERHGSNLTVREAWAPQFDAHGVQAVFAGHNHIFERSVPVRGDLAVADGEGTVYVVTGGAGADLYGVGEEQWFNALQLSVEHFVIADFGPDQVDLVVRDLAGNVLDEFSIPR